jgi:hypothetical protein
MMKQIQKYIYIVGGILLVIGAALYVTRWVVAPYIYVVGSFMFGAMQMADRYEGSNFVIRRLRRQQVLGALMLMLTGIAMFVCKYNEWIVCLLIACLLELYTAFRLPQELEKEGK